MIDHGFMKKVKVLLREADRMDLWKHAFEKDRPEDPVEFVEGFIQQFPEKKEKKVNEIKEISF
jgi:hypothetical protein